MLTEVFLSKVSRNFELVGRVNLDQLEQMKGKTESSSSDEEEKEEELSPKAQERGQCSSLMCGGFLSCFSGHCYLPHQSNHVRSPVDWAAHTLQKQ